jgi:arylsulfatase A-like enzyme
VCCLNPFAKPFFSWLVLVAIASYIPFGKERLSAEQPPNVIVFLSDDQGFGDFSYTGNKDLETPNIDGLARDGGFLNHFFVCPVCSPTRAEFLTGRYHPRGGVYSTSAGGERLDLDESTIAEAFQKAGYATAAFGKWHNGTQAPYHPNSRGFDEYYGFCSGHWGHYFSPLLEHNGTIVRGNGFIVDDLTDHALNFIDDHQDQPFFLYLPYNIPHSPMQVPDKYWQKFENKQLTQMPPEFKPYRRPDKGNDHARAALAMCENIDDNVGRILTRLDELELSDNTIVIYFCDNGPNGPRFNVGLKGRKGSTDEGGVRSPLFMRWPARIKPGSVVGQVAGAIDLFPTLLEMCGISWKPLPEKRFDGISLCPQLLDGQPDQDRFLFSHWNKKISVRTRQYRLDHEGRLYDILDDPGQTSVIEDEPDTRNALLAKVEQFRTDVLAELNRSDRRRFTVGHSSMRQTQLPARDATATGKINRSNRFPNDSYFTNWIDVRDTISWPVEVMQTGDYEATIYYCLSQPDVGTEIELSLGDQRVSSKINTANESPLIGARQDRSIRGESYVKNFKPVKLGVINLNQGTGQLVLKANQIRGVHSIEFRLLLLKQMD